MECSSVNPGDHLAKATPTTLGESLSPPTPPCICVVYDPARKEGGRGSDSPPFEPVVGLSMSYQLRKIEPARKYPSNHLYFHV